jgi:hypothetical protein
LPLCLRKQVGYWFFPERRLNHNSLMNKYLLGAWPLAATKIEKYSVCHYLTENTGSYEF